MLAIKCVKKEVAKRKHRIAKIYPKEYAVCLSVMTPRYGMSGQYCFMDDGTKANIIGKCVPIPKGRICITEMTSNGTDRAVSR